MKRLIWIFISGIFCAVISGCGSIPATTSTLGGDLSAATSIPATTCTVVLPENMALVYSYAGECLNGLAHGKGKVTVEKTYPKTGEKFIITYDGMFQHGQLTGRGKETENLGNHWFEGTFNEWKRWTGTVYFAKTAKQKERQINLREGSVTSLPVDATQDPLYYAEASNDSKDGTQNSEQQAPSQHPQEVKSVSKSKEPLGVLGVTGSIIKSVAMGFVAAAEPMWNSYVANIRDGLAGKSGEVSPANVNGCSNPSISQGMCLSPGYCDDLRSGGQVPCSQLNSAQLEALKNRRAEVLEESARREQEYNNIQAALASKLRDDKTRINRIVEASARQNAKQQEEYARQNQVSQESWAAYQRKSRDDRARFDQEQKKQEIARVAIHDAESERQRQTSEAWLKDYREKQARDAERQKNVATPAQPAAFVPTPSTFVAAAPVITPAPSRDTPAPSRDTPAPSRDTPAPSGFVSTPSTFIPRPQVITPAPSSVTPPPSVVTPQVQIAAIRQPAANTQPQQSVPSTYQNVLTPQEIAWNNSLPNMYRATTQFSPAQIAEIKQDGRWGPWVAQTKADAAGQGKSAGTSPQTAAPAVNTSSTGKSQQQRNAQLRADQAPQRQSQPPVIQTSTASNANGNSATNNPIPAHPSREQLAQLRLDQLAQLKPEQLRSLPPERLQTLRKYQKYKEEAAIANAAIPSNRQIAVDTAVASGKTVVGGLTSSARGFGESIGGAIIPHTEAQKQLIQTRQSEQESTAALVKRIQDLRVEGKDTTHAVNTLKKIQANPANIPSDAELNPALNKTAGEVLLEAGGTALDIASAGVLGTGGKLATKAPALVEQGAKRPVMELASNEAIGPGAAKTVSKRTPATTVKTEAIFSKGPVYRADLAEHIPGPAFKSGKLDGTHNLKNAISELDSRGISHTLKPTGTAGISELEYSYTSSITGKVISGKKTVYDPAIYSDELILSYTKKAGQSAWEKYLLNQKQRTFDVSNDGLNFRVYINTDKAGKDFIGNVHVIK